MLKNLNGQLAKLTLANRDLFGVKSHPYYKHKPISHKQIITESKGANLKVPTANLKVPSANLKVPSANRKVPSANQEVPSANHNICKSTVATFDVDISNEEFEDEYAPQAKYRDPYFDACVRLVDKLKKAYPKNRVNFAHYGKNTMVTIYIDGWIKIKINGNTSLYKIMDFIDNKLKEGQPETDDFPESFYMGKELSVPKKREKDDNQKTNEWSDSDEDSTDSVVNLKYLVNDNF